MSKDILSIGKSYNTVIQVENETQDYVVAVFTRETDANNYLALQSENKELKHRIECLEETLAGKFDTTRP